MGKTIALVACVSKKRNLPQPAKDLYCSEWFSKASKYAARHSTIWYILSAKYGLISPNAIIEPYNETLKTMPKVKRKQWSASVIKDLEKILEPGDQVVVLAGRAYREFLIEPILETGCTVSIPMEGLGIGQQLSWLKQQTV